MVCVLQEQPTKAKHPAVTSAVLAPAPAFESGGVRTTTTEEIGATPKKQPYIVVILSTLQCG